MCISDDYCVLGLPVPSQVTKLLLELNLNLVSVEIVKGDNFLIKGTSSGILIYNVIFIT